MLHRVDGHYTFGLKIEKLWHKSYHGLDEVGYRMN